MPLANCILFAEVGMGNAETEETSHRYLIMLPCLRKRYHLSESKPGQLIS